MAVLPETGHISGFLILVLWIWIIYTIIEDLNKKRR